MRVQHLLGTDICEAVFSSAGSPGEKCCSAAGRCAGCLTLLFKVCCRQSCHRHGEVCSTLASSRLSKSKWAEESSGEVLVSADPSCPRHSSESSTWGWFQKPSAHLGLESPRCIWRTPSSSVSPGKIQFVSVECCIPSSFLTNRFRCFA